jgi:hypothetical protein
LIVTRAPVRRADHIVTDDPDASVLLSLDDQCQRQCDGSSASCSMHMGMVRDDGKSRRRMMDHGAGGLRDLGCGVTLRIAGPAKLRAIHHLMLIEFEPEF